MWLARALSLAFVAQSSRNPAVSDEMPSQRFAVDVDRASEETNSKIPSPLFKQKRSIKAWEGISFVESQGDYAEESFLEDGPLYQHEDELPSLPVPSLEETINRFLPTALPLAKNQEEIKALEAACESFPQEARVLQERLVARAEECAAKNTSWLQEYWQEDVYLKSRDPLNFYSNYFFLIPSAKRSHMSGIKKAAQLCLAAGLYADEVTSAQKVPDFSNRKKKNGFFTSSPFKYLFNACRIPRAGKDTYKIYNPEQYRHVVVAYNGNFWEVPLEDAHGKKYSASVLEDIFTSIVEQDAAPAFELGWLTGANRDSWARTRNLLLEKGGQKMATALERLESAMFMVNLDFDLSSDSLQEQAENYFYGSGSDNVGCNRWFDKSIQFSVTKNGSWGFLGEHSSKFNCLLSPFLASTPAAILTRFFCCSKWPMADTQ
jgi:carnitine O-acetyltransferase